MAQAMGFHGRIVTMKIGVIADDLTGALDTGVQFRGWGLKVEVRVGSDALGSEEDADVLVVDTESRYDPPEAAYEKVAMATGSLAKWGARAFYKKVDSTLRGNIGAELDAVMDASGSGEAFFTPAYPEYGRASVGGALTVYGVPIHETEYASETGVEESHLPTMITLQSERRIGAVGLDAVRDGHKAILREVNALREDGVEVFVFDSATERDMIEIMKASGGVRVFSGSAGLASELPHGMGLRRIKPTLSIVGSTRSVTRTQVRNAVERLGCRTVEVDSGRLLEGGEDRRREIGRCVCGALAWLGGGVDVIVGSALDDSSVAEALGRGVELGMEEASVRASIEEALGALAASISREADISGMILTGGATALRVVDTLGLENISIVEEVRPGIPILALDGGLRVVTKAGGFGGDDALVQAVKHLWRAGSG
jgi:uncharacterized protein YgbK (DUF1537 family)